MKLINNNNNNYCYYCNYAWTLAAVVSMILVCNVARTNCDVEGTGPSESKGGCEGENESFLLVVACTIQSCVDNKTMNNKEFKNELRVIYDVSIANNLKNKIDSYVDVVNSIAKNYENDLKILDRLKSNEASKLEKKPSKK